MTISCDYASPDNHDTVNYHFDANSMTVYPVGYPAVVAFVDGGGTIADYITPLPPSPAPPHLNSGMLIRFSATNPIVVYENLGLAGVSRLTKGRYRINHINPMPSDQYSVFPDVMDAADKRVRYTVRTVDYVEVKVVDTAGAAADASEVSVKIERVITPT